MSKKVKKPKRYGTRPHAGVLDEMARAEIGAMDAELPPTPSGEPHVFVSDDALRLNITWTELRGAVDRMVRDAAEYHVEQVLRERGLLNEEQESTQGQEPRDHSGTEERQV